MVQVAKKVKCLACGSGSIYDSGSNFAVAVRHFIAEQISQGKSESEVLEMLVASYGEEILLESSSDDIVLLTAAPALFFCVFGLYAVRSTSRNAALKRRK